MAEGKERPLEELEKEITCAKCQGIYQQAKLLPCNHYYCSTCIEKMADASRGGTFACPECSKETSLPAGGAAELQPAFFVERMKEVYDKTAKVEGRVEAFCEQCASGNPAAAFCRECEFVCVDCVGTHKNLKVFAGHKVANLDDLRKGNIPLKESPPGKCAEHDSKLKLFCFDCDHLICRDCTIVDHKEHRCEFLSKCASESRKTLQDSLTPLKKVRDKIEGAQNTLTSEQAKIDRQMEEVCRSIQQSFKALTSLLDQRKEELVNKASSLAEEKKDALAAQKTVLQAAQEEVQQLIEVVERNVENTSNQDLMTVHKLLQKKMEEEEKCHQELSLKPSATADIACIIPSPSVIPRHLGSVFDQNTPRAYVTSSTQPELGSPVHLTLSAPAAQLEDVSASLQCVADPPSSLEGNVTKNGAGLFSVSVTPRVRGRHDLAVKVKKKEIAGSPFQVFVKFPLSQFGRRPPRKISILTDPSGIAVNNKRQLIVAVSVYGGKRIAVMEQDGKKVKAFGCDQFKDPVGVAATTDGAIYVTDIDAKRLFKFDSEGKLLNTVLNGFQKPFSVKVIDNQLYVVDQDSQLVKIFDTDFNTVGTIQTTECPKPHDVARGPDGLYVAGKGKISVYRCAPNGTFIRHLNIPSSTRLSEFWGIAFEASGHIIACDHEYGVYAFNLSGERVGYVSSDVIMGPAGVAVDEDGYIYMCSRLTGKVFIF